MQYKEINGDLVKLGLAGKFDVIAHGCNCFCTMGAGLAPQMANAFSCDKFDYEHENYRGDINKLGCIDYEYIIVKDDKELAVINCYSQFGFGINHKEGSVAPLDYNALALCFKKMNHVFKGKHIGLPEIGCHLAGGSWSVVEKMIKRTLKDCDVTVVHYKP